MILMQNQRDIFEYKQIAKIINTKKYRDQSKNQQFINKLINSVNSMEINEESFKIIRILIRFFRFPVLILFRPFFQRLQQNKEKLMSFIEDQKIIGGIVVKILEERNFPSLQFYTKAGFNKGIILQPRIEQKEYADFFCHFDSSLNQIVGDNPKNSLDRLKNLISGLAQFRKQNKHGAIIELCNEAYQSLAMEKIKEIENSIKPRLEKIQYKDERIASKIQIQTANGSRFIDDPRIAKDYLCCRPYFYFKQIINEPETITQQYKNYRYPYNTMLNEIFLKTIVGFLNGKGGIIYIGIKENVNTKKRTIIGEVYNESLKQDVLKHFRYLGQRISPQIVNNQLYKLQFVPLKRQNNFLPGQYIIRVRISKGEKGELYSFKNYDSVQYVAFRTENEVLVRRLSQQILELYRKKLAEPQDLQEGNHSGPCKRPQNGKPVYQNSKASSYQPDNKWVNKKVPNNPVYKEKQQIKNSQLAYFFVGVKVNYQLKPYYHQNYKKLPVIEPTDQQSMQLVRAIVDSSKQKDQYIPVSKKMLFLQQYFNVVWEKLEQKNILTTTYKSSRTTLLFGSIKQAVYAANILRDIKIPFNFQMPK